MSGSANAGSTGRPLHGPDPHRLSEARLQAHYGTQWLARVAHNYVAPLPDDGHTNLGWDDALVGLVTHPLRNGERDIGCGKPASRDGRVFDDRNR
jgi:hypothetical protein